MPCGVDPYRQFVLSRRMASHPTHRGDRDGHAIPGISLVAAKSVRDVSAPSYG